MAGKLIVLEGVDGCGKTTVCNKLELEGYYVCRQPRRKGIGTYIRTLQMSGELTTEPEITDEIFNTLIIADRMEQFFEKDGLVEKLKHTDVIMDRYFYSSLVYSSNTLLSEETLRDIHGRFPQPDLVLFLDVDPEVAMKRMGAREALDVYETLEYLIPRADKYKRILKETADVHIHNIDAGGTEDDVFEEVLGMVENCIHGKW